jgi:3,4-dihydroxy 2-butanone 4-phosphate synthase
MVNRSSERVVEKACHALVAGEIVLLYDFDNREKETDMAIRSDRLRHQDIARLRNDAGGLICTAIPFDAGKKLDIPYARDLLRSVALVEKLGDIPYDPTNQSSFSLWVNHKNTFTGITDRDRALTASAISRAVSTVLSGGSFSFSSAFRTPGHTPILIAAQELLAKRCGQTELSVTLAEIAQIPPVVTICEMLDDDSGYALSKEDAIAYAKRHNAVFIEGADVMNFYETNGLSISHNI